MRSRLAHTFAPLAALTLIAGESSSAQTPARRTLSVVPAISRACPGEIIGATYVLRAADGSSSTLGKNDVAALVRQSEAADPRPDGAWQAETNPLYAAFAGYRLSAALGADTTVRGDTVIAPAAECRHGPIDLGTSQYGAHSAHVRVGVLATPFFDSIVVAVVERDGGPPIVTVLTPREMRSGAIRVNAPGRAGRDGRSGGAGSGGGECESGTEGYDGDPGDPGQSGGTVNIILQADAPWLEEMVAVFNPGGRGGRGGAGGRGGSPGPRTGRAGCNPKAGLNGRAGTPGGDGPPGPPPRVTTVPFLLLWSGSPIWADAVARRALDSLMQYTTQRAR